MKKMLLVVLILFVSSFASAQVLIGGQGGIALSSGKILSVPSSVVAAVTIGVTTTQGNLGTINLVCPTLASGTFQDGGVFNAGGTFVVTVPGQSISYSATLAAGAVWTLVTLANGTHNYVLQNVTLVSSQGTGDSFTLVTGNIGTGKWSGSAAVVSLNATIENP